MNNIDPADELGARALQLTSEVRSLTSEVKALAELVGELRERQDSGERRAARSAWIAAAALALAVVLGAVVLLGYRQISADNRLDTVTDGVLCPTFALLVGGADPTSRPAGPARDAYVASIALMRQSYDRLGCAAVTPLVPPRKGN